VTLLQQGLRPQPDILRLGDLPFGETRRWELLEGDGFHQGKAPGEFLGVEDQRVAVVAGSDGKSDIFCGSDQIAPDHVDIGHENPSLCGSFDLFEPI